jgi:hypothetical protein
MMTYSLVYLHLRLRMGCMSNQKKKVKHRPPQKNAHMEGSWLDA